MSQLRERRCALVYIPSTMAADENHQHTLTNINDVPMHAPDPSPPFNRSTNAPNKPQSFKVKGKRRSWASSNETSPNDKANLLETSGHIKSTDDILKKLQNGSEHVSKCLEQKNEKYHLGGLETSQAAKWPCQVVSTMSQNILEVLEMRAWIEQTYQIETKAWEAIWA